MKALRLRTRSRYRVRWENTQRLSRERRRSPWNISHSMRTSITRWPRWPGPMARWSERNGSSITAERYANSWNAVSRDRRGGRDHRQLVLDRRRDRGRGLCPSARARPQGEADDGHDQQDGQARRARAQPAATERHAADGLDSPRRVARPARPPPHPDGARPAAYAAQESDPRHLGQVRPAQPGRE